MSLRALILANLSLILLVCASCDEGSVDEGSTDVVDDGDESVDATAEVADDMTELAPDVADIADGVSDADINDLEDAIPEDVETSGDLQPEQDADTSDDSGEDAETDGGPVVNCDIYTEQAEICIDGSCRAIGFVPQFEQALIDGRQRKVVEVVYTEAGGGYWFVLSQEGIITAISEESGESHDAAEISNRMRVNGGEEGLLGIAFPQDFPENPEVYLSYTADDSTSEFPRASLLTRMPVNTDDWTFDTENEEELLRVPQPASNHNGGSIRFGPDNHLYLSLGDGGGANDGFNNGQNKNSLLGVILRLDVLNDSTAPGKAYAVPADNPFVDADGADEIYAYGLRNVWKFSFDAVDGRLFAADVGQRRFEEVNIVESGGNYGWPLKEGFACFDAEAPCDAETLGVQDPIWTYDHSLGVSITGGYVYRGADFPALAGRYLAADYGSGRLWFLTDQGDGTWDETLIKDTRFSISGFAENRDRELMVFNYRFTEGPAVYQLSPLPESCE